MKILLKLLLLTAAAGTPFSSFAAAFNSELYRFEAEVVAGDLAHPWGMAFLPEGGILVTERNGKINRR